MKSFTKKEQIVILVVVFIIIISLGLKIVIGKIAKPSGLTVELDTIEDVELAAHEIVFDEEDDDNEEIMVHISGQVYKPGIIILESGKRLVDAIELAGGLKKDADLDRINLAKKLSDEEKIYISKIGEESNPEIETVSMESTGGGSSGVGKININTCSKEELIKLPGIGEVIAGRIIEYRANNSFKNIDDIKLVSGIGDKKFEGIQELIIVKWRGVVIG